MCLKESTMRQGVKRQRELFGETESVFPVQVTPEVHLEAKRLLVLWMQAVAKAISEETGDEQDPR
jgi:hypothetical protein